MPFANISGDEATGITDLSHYRAMDVIDHNSTAAYNGKTVDAREVGKNLNVRYVLEGSVQREGDQIRVTAQLIDANSNAHLWSERWDKPSKEFFAAQSDIADELGNRLGGAGGIDKAEQEAARRSSPENFTAYELYLAGRGEYSRMTQEGNRKAIEAYEKAVATDPRLARAWAELSFAHHLSMNFGTELAVANPLALAAARRAIEIDPGDARAHMGLAIALATKGDLVASEAEFDTALRLNPGDAEDSPRVFKLCDHIRGTRIGLRRWPIEQSGSIQTTRPGGQWTYPMPTSVTIGMKTPYACSKKFPGKATTSLLGSIAPRVTPRSAGRRKRKRPSQRRLRTFRI
jgi:TolB-like protein